MNVVPLAMVMVDPSVPVVAAFGLLLLPVLLLLPELPFEPALSAELPDDVEPLLDSFFLMTMSAATAPAAMTTFTKKVEECT